jgi:DNA-directed RNA polymerase subunit RPC12/RpoP
MQTPPQALPSLSDSELLTLFFVNHDARCPHCEYQLRSVRGESCPECGGRLVLGLPPVIPRRLRWLLLAAFTCIIAIGLGQASASTYYALEYRSYGASLRSNWWIYALFGLFEAGVGLMGILSLRTHLSAGNTVRMLQRAVFWFSLNVISSLIAFGGMFLIRALF